VGASGKRRRGHSKEGRDNQPQVIITDGMPARSWVLPGDSADVGTVARIKDYWQLGRRVFRRRSGMYSAENLAVLLRRWHLQVKEVVVGKGERRRRYVLGSIPRRPNANAAIESRRSPNVPANLTCCVSVRTIA
jgi:hypothetical protein